MFKGLDVIREGKACNTCLKVKLLSEYYSQAATNDGKAYTCKVCERARAKKYRDSNKENLKEYHKKYYTANRERLCARTRAYQQQNNNHMREYFRNYYLANIDKIKARQKKYREKRLSDKLSTGDYKSCTVCNKLLRFSDFNKNRNSKDGYQHSCRKCTAAYKKKKYKKDLWHNRALSRQYYRDHQEELKIKRDSKTEETKAYNAKYRIANAERIKAYQAEYYKKYVKGS